MIRRAGLAVLLAVVLLVVLVPSAQAAGALDAVDRQDPPATATTVAPSRSDPAADLPGTTLEAEERDDGTGSAAPWLIGSGIAAAAAIAVGGWLLQRRAG